MTYSKCFHKIPDRLFDKERLYEAAWGLDGLGNNSVVAEHIRKIRAKFAAVGAKQYIETVWGVGYKWEKASVKLNDLSILSTFALLAVVFLLLAMLLVEVERTLLTNAQRDIAFQYSDVVEGFNSEKVWGNQSVYLLSEHDGRMMWLYEMGMWTLPPFTYLACFFGGICFLQE